VASLHLDVNYTMDDDGANGESHGARSNWVDALVGYQPPIAAVATSTTGTTGENDAMPLTIKPEANNPAAEKGKFTAPVLTGPTDGAAVVCMNVATVGNGPNKGQILGQVPLFWSPVPGAILYQVEVSTDNTFATILDSTGRAFSTTAFIPQPTVPNGLWNLPTNQTYYWRVKAIGSNVVTQGADGVYSPSTVPSSDWSPTQSLTVQLPDKK
jgi:hypothetical protein